MSPRKPAEISHSKACEGFYPLSHTRARGRENRETPSDAFDPFAACPIAEPANAPAVQGRQGRPGTPSTWDRMRARAGELREGRPGVSLPRRSPRGVSGRETGTPPAVGCFHCIPRSITPARGPPRSPGAPLCHSAHNAPAVPGWKLISYQGCDCGNALHLCALRQYKRDMSTTCPQSEASSANVLPSGQARTTRFRLP